MKQVVVEVDSLLLLEDARCREAPPRSSIIRALLEFAPPLSTLLRDGQLVELPTAEVQVEDVVLVRPGDKIPCRRGGCRRRVRG